MRCTTAALVVLLTAGIGAAEPRPAPGWELHDLDGTPHRLEEWRGKWVLLKLGTTQCPNCALQMQEFADVEKDLAALGVEVLDIYLREDRYAVNRYWEKKNFRFRPTVLYDHKGGLVRDYGVSIIPHLFLVDPQGRIAWEAGFTPGSSLISSLSALVGSPAPKSP